MNNEVKGVNIILADPPWKYTRGDMHDGSRSTDHYPSMSLDELKSMKDWVQSTLGDKCLLYMWTTAPKMDNAVELGKAWGFTYSTVAFVWDKMRTLAGNYTITECEFVLVFKHKKKRTPKRAKTNAKQFFQQKPREHSRKPDYVKEMIEQMYPDAVKLELFARETRDGWMQYGNEVNKFDDKQEVYDE